MRIHRTWERYLYKWVSEPARILDYCMGLVAGGPLVRQRFFTIEMGVLYYHNPEHRRVRAAFSISSSARSDGVVGGTANGGRPKYSIDARGEPNEMAPGAHYLVL